MYNKQIGYHHVENIYTSISTRKEDVQRQIPQLINVKRMRAY